MNNLVFLEYCFLVDPTGMYLSLDQFEKDLSDFFSAHGKEVQILDTARGYLGRRILLIKKIEEKVEVSDNKLPPLKSTLSKEKNPTQALNELRK